MSESSGRATQTQRGGCFRRVVGVLAAVLALAPAAIHVVQRWPGEDWWLGAALVYAPKMQWLVLPGLGLVLALIAMRGRLVLLNAASGAFTLFVLANFQVSTLPPIPEGRPLIRLATWNVYGWTEERELVRDRIMSWDCDIVCLQESVRPVFRDLLPGYDSAAAGDLRVYVRGRILDHRAPRDPMSHNRRILICDVETDAGRFTVINVHIPRAERARRTPRQFEPLIRYIESGVRLRGRKFEQLMSVLPEQGPLIVAGDMNTPPASRYYRQMAQRMTDSFAAVGRGFGNTFVWRRELPLLRIDYVWTAGGIDPIRCETKEHRPSDHRPVVAVLALPAEIPDAAPSEEEGP